MTTILAAVDETPAAHAVLATTCAIGRALNLGARALHVGATASASRAAAAQYDLPLTVVPGDPAEQIIAAAQDPEVALVVLALHGQPGTGLPGRTALAVATRLDKPVVVVPPDEAVRSTPSRILLPLDGTHPVSIGVRPLISACVAAGLEVVALHVFEPSTVPRFLDGAPDAAIWRDEFLAQHCAELGLRLETRAGPARQALVELAAAEDVDAIALGWRQDISPDRAQLVRHALLWSGRPVVLIPLAGPQPAGEAAPDPWDDTTDVPLSLD